MPVTELTDETGKPIDASVVIDTSPPVSAEAAFTLPVATAPEPQVITAPATAPPGLPAAGDITPVAGGDPPATGPAAPVPFWQRFQLPAEMVPDEAAAEKLFGDALAELATQHREIGELRQWADLGRRLYHQQTLPQQPGSQPAAPATSPSPSAQPTLPWSPVQADPLWERYRDATSGQYLLEKMPAPMQENFLRYAHGLRQFNEKLYREGDQLLNPLVEKATQPLVQKIEQLEQLVRRQPEEAESKQWLEHNQQWMLQTSPLTGRVMLTPAGQHFKTTYEQALMQGLPERHARDFALQATEHAAMRAALQANGGQPPPGAAGAPAPPTNDQLKAAALASVAGAAAVRTPSRAGSIAAATPAVPQNRPYDREADITRRVNESMRALGVTDEASQISYSPVQ